MRLGHAVQAIAAALIMPAALELCSASRVLAAIQCVPVRRRVGDDPVALARLVDSVLARLPWIWRRTCLRRAIALVVLLRRGGHSAEVVIGVRRSAGGELEAHAWLRCDGVEPYLEAGPAEGGAWTTLRPASHVTS
jgi:transglutaminase superfamily protein